MLKQLSALLLFTMFAGSAFAANDVAVDSVVNNPAKPTHNTRLPVRINHSNFGIKESSNLSIDWNSADDRSAVALTASLRGGEQFSRHAYYHPSDSEKAGVEADAFELDTLGFDIFGLDGLKIKGLRVGARIRF